MRPPTEMERLAVFIAAMVVTRALLPRPNPTTLEPDSLDGFIAQAQADYRARYGAHNPGAN